MEDDILKIKKLYQFKFPKTEEDTHEIHFINNFIKNICKNKTSRKIIKNLNKILFLIILSFIFLFILNYQHLILTNSKYIKDIDNKLLLNKITEKDIDEEYKDIDNYINLLLNHTKIDKDKIYYPSQNPKISIIISVYNGEGYLNTTLLSIQNQDLKDIEIILVDDGSKDNSVNLIKELMKTEPRIVLIENKENRGQLYSVSRGILNSKGKYLMLLDEDDIYVQRDAFSSLYTESEKNNLDILYFMGANSEQLAPRSRRRFSDTKTIKYQPELGDLMYHLDSNGKVWQFYGSLALLFIKTHLCKKIIKLIDEKNLNTHMNYHVDFIIMFLLFRNAYNFKSFNRLFHVWLHIWKKNDPNVKFRTEEKMHNQNNQKCFAYLNFYEILFKNTNNTFKDKKIAFSQIEDWYLRTHCRTNEDNREKAIEVFKLYLNCKYISNEDKKKIHDFIINNNNLI